MARDGPSTPYALKAAVGRGIAHFWQFPHSQIYAETERLARLGLLADWLAEPTDEPLQVRSLGLLKLYFAQHAEPEDVAELARVQAELLQGGAELMGDAFRVMAGHWERVERAFAAPTAHAAAGRGR